MSKEDVMRAYDALYEARKAEAIVSAQLSRARALVVEIVTKHVQTLSAVDRAQAAAENAVIKAIREETTVATPVDDSAPVRSER